MKKPVITLTGVYSPKHQDSAWAYNINYINEAYTDRIYKAGALPRLIPYLDYTDEEADQIMESTDAFFIPGGIDFNSELYGEKRLEGTDNPIEIMDKVQLRLIKKAVEKGKWVFGVCRGIQAVNIAMGGTLYQNIPSQHENSLEHMRRDSPNTPVHKDYLEEDSLLYKAFGKKEIEVNSLHHQGVKTLGKNLKATAVSEDGIIEAVEGINGKKILAVQWHPEALEGPFFDFLVSLLK